MLKFYYIVIKKVGLFIVLVIIDLFRYFDYFFNVFMFFGKVYSFEGCFVFFVFGVGFEDFFRIFFLSFDNLVYFFIIYKFFIYLNIYLDLKYFF